MSLTQLGRSDIFGPFPLRSSSTCSGPSPFSLWDRAGRIGLPPLCFCLGPCHALPLGFFCATRHTVICQCSRSSLTVLLSVAFWQTPERGSKGGIGICSCSSRSTRFRYWG